MTKESSNKFRFFSFVSALVVIGYHARLPFLEEYNLVSSASPYISRLYDCFCSIAMSFFFMTSGYMLYHGATNENAGKKFGRRIHSLLIPYIIWNLIYMGLYLVFRRDYFKNGITDIFYGFIFTPFNGPFWYVLAIFCLSAFVMPVVRLYRTQPLVLKIAFILLIILSIAVESCSLFSVFGISEENVILVWIVRLFRYLPAYMIGSYIGLTHSDWVDYRLQGKGKLYLFLFFVLTGLCSLLVPDQLKLVKQVCLTIQPMMLWMIVDNRFFLNKNAKIQGAFLLYALHSMIILISRYTIEKMLPSGMNETAVLLLYLSVPFIMMLLTYIASHILGIILRRFHLRYLESALTGGRE